MGSWPGRWSQMGQTEKNSARANVFRVTLELGHCPMKSALRICANNGLMHRSERQLYSITSSAWASSVGGTVRPSDLAVLMLITNSNLVGCCTGRSDGLAPLRIFPA